MTERQVTLPLKKAEQLLEVLDELDARLRDSDHLGDWERAQQLEALRQDLELAILRCPR